MFGLELHPAVIHYPIALGTIGSLALLAYAILRKDWLRWFGPILLTLALAGAGAAYFSGESASDRAEHAGVPEAAIEKHEESCLWALGGLGLATLLAWAVRPKGRGIWLSALVALAAAGLTLYTGYLGGELVYRHGAGTIHSAAQTPKPPPTHEEEEH